MPGLQSFLSGLLVVAMPLHLAQQPSAEERLDDTTVHHAQSRHQEGYHQVEASPLATTPRPHGSPKHLGKSF